MAIWKTLAIVGNKPAQLVLQGQCRLVFLKVALASQNKTILQHSLRKKRFIVLLNVWSRFFPY